MPRAWSSDADWCLKSDAVSKLGLQAQRVLDNHDASNPLFVYFAHQLIHDPLEQPPDAASKAACAKENASSPIGEWATVARHTLCTMASEVDTAVGEFVGMLQAKGMWEDTILWVTTDNGGMTTGPRYDEADVSRAWSAASNFPLRGGKVREKLNDCSSLLRPMPYG